MTDPNSEAVRGLTAIEQLIIELSGYSGFGVSYLSDARSTFLRTASVDAIITSPPYINVFNYHQNYRPAVESLGWRPLEAAQSEIGANRKHRGNRFLTVIQYCLDMAQALNEMARVCKPGAPVILIVGRESKVLGASLRNGEIIRQLLELSGAFEIQHTNNRVFINRFGQYIYEDVIICRCVNDDTITQKAAAIVGRDALEMSLPSTPAANRDTLNAAKNLAFRVQPSRELSLTRPNFYQPMLMAQQESFMQVNHPTTHGDKLKALLNNDGLPTSDRPRVTAAIAQYDSWIGALKNVQGEGDNLLTALAALLNDYKTSIDLNLIFDAEDGFLYRQNGQLKLSNSVLEEFLPYLFDARLVPGFKRLNNVVSGPQASFAGLSFGPPFLAFDAGGVYMKSKDQDFSIAKTHRMTIRVCHKTTACLSGL